MQQPFRRNSRRLRLHRPSQRPPPSPTASRLALSVAYCMITISPSSFSTSVLIVHRIWLVWPRPQPAMERRSSSRASISTRSSYRTCIRSAPSQISRYLLSLVHIFSRFPKTCAKSHSENTRQFSVLVHFAAPTHPRRIHAPLHAATKCLSIEQSM